jgi:hypothetical protein
MGSGLAAVIMTGGGGRTPVEQLVARAREAITCDTVDRLLRVEPVERIIVATDSPNLPLMLGDRPVIVDVDVVGELFHFGRRLTRILATHDVERCLYIGGGSGALLTTEEWQEIAVALVGAEDTVITNNFYSSDFAAWAPARALESTSLPANDNELAWALRFDAGLPTQTLPRSAATQLDVDTPTDLMTLGLHPSCGPCTRRYLDMLNPNISQDMPGSRIPGLDQGLLLRGVWDSLRRLRCTLEQVLGTLLDREAEVFVAGRVSAAAAAYLQTEALCRKRILAEERGMRASGRQARGEVRSVLGALLEDRGPWGFFEALAQMGQAVVLDSRVILAHRQSWPSTADRFRSDLCQTEQIEDAFLREFTAAALAASIPVVLGGHSLVSGGLWALVDAAWSRVEEDVPRRSGGPRGT